MAREWILRLLGRLCRLGRTAPETAAEDGSGRVAAREQTTVGDHVLVVEQVPVHERVLESPFSKLRATIKGRTGCNAENAPQAPIEPPVGEQVESGHLKPRCPTRLSPTCSEQGLVSEQIPVDTCSQPPVPEQTVHARDLARPLLQGRDAADNHIREIRRANGGDQDVSSAMVKNLEAACKVLSEQLYESSTRFLQELIQNADDNTYLVAEPALEFVYDGDSIRINCNEVGFTHDNVVALCNLGQSSKAGSTAHTGEKGIGFKSVFRVADVVSIISGDYSFQFDANKRLGMICPYPAAFPDEAPAPGWTSFHLKVKPADGNPELRPIIDSALANLGPTTLAFLRRLRRISIVNRTKTQESRVLVHRIVHNQFGEVLQLSSNETTTSFVLRRRLVRDMPPEPRRGNVPISEVALAFPVSPDLDPLPQLQDVYAFLPVKDYGFKFMIQSNFILTANRESIEGSMDTTTVSWNRRLSDGLVDVFLDAVVSFNQMGFNKAAWRYQWIRFLPDPPGPLDFFREFRNDLIAKLKVSFVLEACDGSMQRPPDLCRVPSPFRDDDGMPLLLNSTNGRRYLSPRYSDDHWEHIRVLGVAEMTIAEFLDELEQQLGQAAATVHQKAREWHANVALALRMGSTNAGNESTVSDRLKSLRLIKLQGGDWMAAQGNTIYFSAEAAQYAVPTGLGLLVVDPDFASESAIRLWYTSLGVTTLGPTDVQAKILALHSRGRAAVSDLSDQDLASHAQYLYLSLWQNPGSARIVAAVSRPVQAAGDHREWGDECYIDDEDELSAKRLFHDQRHRFSFLSEAYFRPARFQNNPDWVRWLENHMGATKLPRLLPNHRGAKMTLHLGILPARRRIEDREIHKDFLWVADNIPSRTWLRLICEKWGTYESIQRELFRRKSTCSMIALENRISAIHVRCRDGSSQPMSSTYLPVDDVQASTDAAVPLIDVEDPLHNRWETLKRFKVGIRNDARFYLLCLTRLSGTPNALDKCQRLLGQIQSHADSSEQSAIVKAYFQKSTAPLIFVPDMPPRYLEDETEQVDDDEKLYAGGDRPAQVADNLPGSWHKLENCLWDGVRYVQAYRCLKEVYPGLERLFKRILDVPDLEAKHIMTELGQFTLAMKIPLMYRILRLINKQLNVGNISSLSTEVSRLKGMPIWPIEGPLPPRPGEATRLASASGRGEWFIADLNGYRQTFSGRIPMLAFNVEQQHKLWELMKAVGVHDRDISRHVKVGVGNMQETTAHPEYTEWFRSKAPFVARLLNLSEADARSNARRTLRKFRQLEVYTAPRLVQHSTIRYQNQTVEGQMAVEKIVVVKTDASFRIYLATTHFYRGIISASIGDRLLDTLHHPGFDRFKKRLQCIFYMLEDAPDNEIHKSLDSCGLPRTTIDDEDDDYFALGTRAPRRLRAPPNVAALARVKGVVPHAVELSRELFEPETRARARGPWPPPPPPAPAIRTPVECETEILNLLRSILGDSCTQLSHQRQWIPGAPARYTGPVFSFPDTEGKFTTALRHLTPAVAPWIEKPPKYHVSVFPWSRQQDLVLNLPGRHWNTARHIWGKRFDVEGCHPSEVLIFALVCDRGVPQDQIVLLVNPFQMFLDGSLSLDQHGFVRLGVHRS